MGTDKKYSFHLVTSIRRWGVPPEISTMAIMTNTTTAANDENLKASTTSMHVMVDTSEANDTNEDNSPFKTKSTTVDGLTKATSSYGMKDYHNEHQILMG